MRKLFSLIAAMIVGAVAMTAQQVTVQLYVDDASHYTLRDQMSDPVDLVNGFNFITAPQFDYYTLYAADGYYIKSVKVNGEEEFLWSNNSYSIFFGEGFDGAVIEVESGSYADARTASFTLKTDDYEKVRIYCSNNYSQPELTSNTTEIAFDPENETSWVIYNSDYADFYKVTYNGAPVTSSYGQYNIYDMADGAVVEVTTQFPEMPVAVHFNIGADQEGILADVKVNGESVTDFLSPDFTVNAGSKLELFCSPNWNVYSVSINGNDEYFYNGKSVTVLEETTIAFTGEKKVTTPVHIVVDNPDAIEFYLDGFYSGVKVPLNAGVTTVDAAEYTSMAFRSTEGYLIASAVRINQDGNSEDLYISNNTEVYDTYYNTYGQCTYSITAASLADTQTATLTINIDKPEEVMVSNGMSEVSLVAGTNVIKFSPEFESQWTIGPKNYSTTIYKVTLNGIDVNPQWGMYNMTVADGDVIDITVAMPEGNAPVHFVYTSDLARRIVTGVEVDYLPVSDYNEAGFEVPFGSSLLIRFDTSAAKLTQLLVNGADVTDEVYGSYYTTILGETTFEISATPYKNNNVTIDVDNAAAVNVTYMDYSMWMQVSLNLTDGTNTFELPESVSELLIEASNQNYVIDGVTVDGAPVSEGWGGYVVNVTDGMTIAITTHEIVRDNKAIAYIGTGTYYSMTIAGAGYFEALDIPYSDVTEPYYKEFSFDNADNPMRLSINSPDQKYVYINGEEVFSDEESYFNLPDYTFKNGDVVKVYDHEPYDCVVFVTAPENSIDVTVDRIVPVADYTVLLVKEGTEISIAAADGAAITAVYAGSTEIQPVDGKYTFIATAYMNVRVEARTTGIEGVSIESTSCDVYNAQGALIMRGADASKINALPRGVYIINGKKVVK